ncbi:exopolysaccharide biosynthesis polyprenyl glycosylphosphotransferase [Sphingomonas crusticola]|uniref:exopolysaccharide biosynthesis polyprenyl glycosylphosphotransferase n=1 Tax=Sphingomonas crusticola TaxID=1697973 RepID=UPI0013C32B04|nr:exopolysaccharide biosynthesis polyprenyl glycosylphosphotransferase [Sphingomonas crusticola]
MADNLIARLSGIRDRARTSRKSVLRWRLFEMLAAGDVIAVFGGMAVASAFRLHDVWSEQTVKILLVLIPVFVGLSLNNRAYGIAVLENWRLGVRRSLSSLVMTGFIVVGIGFALKVSSEYSRLAIGVGFGISAALLVLFRYLVKHAVTWLTADGLYEEVVLCDNVAAIARPGTKILHADALGLKPILTSPQMLDRIGKALRSADRVVVVCEPGRRRAWTLALKGLGTNIEVLIPEVEQLGLLSTSYYGDQLTAVVAQGPLGAGDEIVKRCFDLAALFLVSPIFLLVTAAAALAIKLEDGGPIFFVQSRIGRGNRQFRMYKFRSMRVAEHDAQGHQSTRRDDDRVTRVGRLLRKTSIDELPQLFNVLKGDMSIVGPRPHAVGSTAGDALFWEVDERYWLRHAAKPGLTGLAQVRGFRGATSTAADLTNRIQADLEYLSGWTLTRDLRILLATVRVILHPNAF